MPERRRSVRIPREHAVAGQSGMTRTLDISRDGMLIETASPPPVGTRVELRITLGGQEVAVRGRVVRHVALPGGRTGVGLQIEEMDPRSRMVLALSLVQ